MSVSLAKQITQLNTAHKPTVFVIALNSTQLLQRCQAQFEQAPYQALPKTPVIYVLPEATHNRSGANVSLPAGKTAQNGTALGGGVWSRYLTSLCGTGDALRIRVSAGGTVFFTP